MRTVVGSRNSRLALAICAAAGFLAAGGQQVQAAAACASVAGNLVTNCGFEDNTLNAPTGWTTGGSGVSLTLSGLQHTGERSLYMNFDAPGDTVVSQLVGGAGTYNVSFWLDLYSQGVPSSPLPKIVITFGDQTLNVNPSIDNNQDPQYSLFQFSNVTTAAPALLRFETSGTRTTQFVQYVNFLVDDVLVTQVATAVPEPSALGKVCKPPGQTCLPGREVEATI